MIGKRAAVPAGAAQLFEALGTLLRDAKIDPEFKAMTLTLPSESEIGLALRTEKRFIDPAAIYASRKTLMLALARYLRQMGYGDYL